MHDVFKGEILAILPKYISDRGNCTIVVKEEGKTIILNKSIKTTINLLGKYYMIDLAEVKKRYREIVLSTNLIPIPLSKRDIFVPLKTRYPIFKNDGAFGYINLRFIEKIKTENLSTMIYLKYGYVIECLSNIDSINHHIKDAKIISRCYEGYGMEVAEEGESFRYL
ncbi:MAG TPA: hypothetical protein VFC79_07315 [Tissierellaceae bacterium]|nr:hypothetical protein [Tissierellaceae bacterium]